MRTGPLHDNAKRRLTEYTITRVYDAQCSRAARAAVITPALGTPAALKDPAKALKQLRKIWFARLLALQAAGWQRLPTWKSVTFAANCPPFSVETGKKQHRCRLSWICPFCYARENVIEPFRAAEEFLFGGRKSNVPLRPDLRIIWFETQQHTARDVRSLMPAARTPDPARVGASPFLAEPAPAAVLPRIKLDRKGEVRHFSAVAGVANYQLEPLKDGAGVGVWLMAAPLVFWAPTAAAYATDTLVGTLVFTLAVLVPGTPGTRDQPGPDAPPGWA